MLFVGLNSYNIQKIVFYSNRLYLVDNRFSDRETVKYLGKKSITIGKIV